MNQDRFKFRAWDTEKKAWKGLWIFRGGHSGEYDVSNTEIDILNLEGRWGSTKGDRYRVIWSNSRASFVCKDAVQELSLSGKYLKIIGNIYDSQTIY